MRLDLVRRRLALKKGSDPFGIKGSDPFFRNSLSIWGRTAVTLWGILLLGVCCYVLLWPKSHTVYTIFERAAEDWRAGKDLYGGQPDMDRYRYSPAVAVFFVPFTLLPLGVGGVAWRLLSAAVYLGGLAAWGRYLLAGDPEAKDRRRALAVLFLLVLPLSVTNLRNGQTNALILGLLMLSLTAATRQRWNLAALCLAVATLVKVYPIAVGLLLVLLYPRRLGPRLAVALVAGIALPFLCQRPEYVAQQYANWRDHLASDHRINERTDMAYRDVRLLLPDAVAPADLQGYLVIQLAAAGAAAVLVAAGRVRELPTRRLLPLVLALGCGWMTVFGSATEGATYLLLAAPAAWAVLDASRRRRPRLLLLIVLPCYVLLVLAQAGSWTELGRHWGRFVQPAAGLLLVGSLAMAAVWQMVLPRGPAEVPGPQTARAA